MGKNNSELLFPADHALKLYEQVIHYVTVRIDRGDWQTDMKLPSVRSLAQELGVHRLTVFRAYQELKQRGLVYVRDKSGYYVHASQATGHAKYAGYSGHTSIDLTIHSKSAHAADDPSVSAWRGMDGLTRVQSVNANFQFSKALIDPSLLPNRFWGELMIQVFEKHPKVAATYSAVQGDTELREAMAQHFSVDKHFALSPDEVMITSGAQQAIDLIARSLLHTGDRVLIERPAYGPAMEIFRRQGARLTMTDIRPEGYDMDQIEWCMKTEKPRLFYMNPTFHNPTGFTVPDEQRKRLPELAERYGCLIVEDDSTYDISFGQKPPSPIFAYDVSGSVVYIRSYSKYVAPGLRIAAVTCRPQLMNSLLNVKALVDNGSPLLNQKLFLQYFQSPRMQQHIKKLCIALQIRKETMEDSLRDSGWTWTSPAGGLNLWLQLPSTLKPNELLAKSVQESVSFVPGNVFDPIGAEGKTHVRLSYSYANELQIKEGISTLLRISRTM
ncbi:PLP-dependent aminotransferase family protein [Paenibacillus polymyxa]|uniref:aminotransferase-like domain-containing protein n=1 Tax=Paenibacillus polymyxa TaxID=1406 RepID=UPI0004D50EC2|nr:PLP-dependent aminotransferase family protein [Paenibacillus polymyxa]KEO80294.1 GntR family transcriptional regulator [Paenibacillus polymyxa]MCH6186406.1 PLP-dependent aminotransferase family protein [Paenibacillus polymyxa]MDY8091729.1 PLP-dependent aminotransferase family protein [Paenibacillus polymyxa]WRL60602.1 PLP-dependent aminotransferase family protein [Paenibacillus polymyxa]